MKAHDRRPSKDASRPRRLPWLALAAVLGLVGFVVGLWPRAQRGRATATADDNPGAPASISGRAAALRTPPVPKLVVGARADDEAEPPRARRLISGMRLTALNRAAVLAPLGIEAEGNSMVPYLEGALAMLRQLDPDLIPIMREQLADDVCKEGTTDREAMLYAKMVLLDGGLGSPRAFECWFARHQGEDVLLWSMLDAWQSAGREKTPALARLGDSATDQRTKLRLMDPKAAQEQMALLSAQAKPLPSTSASRGVSHDEKP
jgi:hypothetical protein